MMRDKKTPDTGPDERPLLTSAIVVKIGIGFLVLACLTLALIFAGRWLGARLAMGGFTDSREILDVFIGQDHLKLPANTIRTDNQRKTGTAEQVDIVLTWPELEGYTHDNRNRFYDVSEAGSLIFVEISQRTMTHDMAGRFEPIYKLLLQPQTRTGPAGLEEYSFKDDSSYRGEVLFVSPSAPDPSFAIRCIQSDENQEATHTDCQYDTDAGQDLTLMTRYSKRLLPQWKEIDSAVKAYIKQHIVE